MSKHIHIHIGTRDDAADKAKVAQLISDAKELKRKCQQTFVKDDGAKKELASAARTMDSVISDLEEAKGIA